ncbi:hypothetical protein D3C73_386820 [compost metagenome]
MNQLLQDHAGVGEFVHRQQASGFVQFFAQFQAGVDPGQHQAQFMGQDRQQLFAVVAQYAQRLLHRHA